MPTALLYYVRSVREKSINPDTSSEVFVRIVPVKFRLEFSMVTTITLLLLQVQTLPGLLC